MVFNTGPYAVLPDNSILITANRQSETGFPSSHQLKSYVASKSRLKLAARAVLSADAGLLVWKRYGGVAVESARPYASHLHFDLDRQITTPAPHHSSFYGPDALPATQPTASKH